MELSLLPEGRAIGPRRRPARVAPDAPVDPVANGMRDLARLSSLALDHASTGAVPATWRRPGVAASVDAVRSQLAPVPSRPLLASAYAREAERIARLRAAPQDLAPRASPPSPTDLAYAVRWIELGPEGHALPAWLAWLDGG
jgi:hypothetical protein